MSLLTFTGLAQSFGAADIFKGVSGSLPHGGKVGLVGPNGIGKTTLLLILAGLAQPTAGSAHLARGRRLGYLRQEAGPRVGINLKAAMPLIKFFMMN